MKLTIQTRIMLLALVPLVVVACLLTFFNMMQARSIGNEAVDEFAVQMQESSERELLNYLELARTSIAPLYEGSDGDLEELQAEAKSILRGLRFDDAGSEGYFFVYDPDGNILLHDVTPSLEGQNLIDIEDQDGKRFVEAMIDGALANSGEFVRYWWETDDHPLSPKLSQAIYIEEWDWVLGTGFWIDGVEDQVAATQSSVNSAVGAAFTQSLLVALAAVLAIAALALFIARSVVRPLKRAVQAMNEVAQGEGDLTRRLDAHNRDELGELGQAFNAFADQVAELVGHIRTSVGDMNMSIQNLNGIMEQADSGVAQQHHESEQAATAITEMSAASQEVAQSAQEASTAADEAETKVQEAQHVLKEAMSVIEGLADKVEQGVSVVNKLGEESQNIGGVLDVIRGIAEQTNLLALNAAIEAARAGEAGRGFAVVADEVRTLASRTQESTQEIESMINRLQDGSQEVVSVIEQIRTSSNTTVEESRQVEEALAIVLKAANTINNQNAQIASAAEEQTSVSDTINQNMHQIVSVTEQTAAGTQDAIKHTKNLASTASDLDNHVQRYTI